VRSLSGLTLAWSDSVSCRATRSAGLCVRHVPARHNSNIVLTVAWRAVCCRALGQGSDEPILGPKIDADFSYVDPVSTNANASMPISLDAHNEPVVLSHRRQNAAKVHLVEPAEPRHRGFS
jgi:hypothetical protein